MRMLSGVGELQFDEMEEDYSPRWFSPRDQHKLSSFEWFLCCGTSLVYNLACSDYNLVTIVIQIWLTATLRIDTVEMDKLLGIRAMIMLG